MSKPSVLPGFENYVEHAERIAEDQPPRRVTKLRRIEFMHATWGRRPTPACGKPDTCGLCKHLYRKKFSSTYFKCNLYGNTNGEGTDWRLHWTACGKFEQRKEKAINER